jgi:hypothetical protein
MSQLLKYSESDESLFPRRLTTRVPIFPLDSLEMDVSQVYLHEWCNLPEMNADGSYSCINSDGNPIVSKNYNPTKEPQLGLWMGPAHLTGN